MQVTLSTVHARSFNLAQQKFLDARELLFRRRFADESRTTLNFPLNFES